MNCNRKTRTQSGADLIRIERARQIVSEGFGSAHDDGHSDECLAQGAIAYLTCDKRLWPFGEKSFKQSDRIRDLTKAGAMIAAEIDRLIRKYGRNITDKDVA